MSDMTNRQKQMWIDLVTTFLREEYIEYIMKHPSKPTLKIQPGDVLLGETLDEEERFLYSILPSPENCHKITSFSIPAINLLWDVWWMLVSQKHRLVGNLGIRKGWVLVQPKQENFINGFVEELREALGMEKVLVGKFEFKKEAGEKILPS